MDSIFEKITKAINDFLMSVIESSLSTMFNDVNEKVGTIAAEVGKTPQQWNASVFSIIETLSENVILPIAGLIGHTVTETRVDGHLQMIQKDLTKNNSSFRSLPLVAPIKELLNEKRKSIYECKKLFKSGYCSKYSDYVCVNEIRELIQPRTLSDNFKRIIKKNNIRNLRLYDCRHTAASIMLKNGVSMKQIQMILGHSDYATTANIYSHLDYADKVSATKEMKNILYGNE